MPAEEHPIPSLAVLDPERLAALESYGVLDSSPEKTFDDVVAVAADLCDAPCALISLVAAERQWFKARIGVEACETPIDQSVCAHALSEDEILVIPDLTLDPRTAENTLVTGEAGLRFYGGVVLRTPEGHALGSLCVIDTTPRPQGLTDRQINGLKALARQTMALLEMRKAVIRSADEASQTSQSNAVLLAAGADLRESSLKLRLAVDATRMGIFDYDLATGELVWDARVRELFGVSSTADVTYESAFLAGVHPDDREAADRAVQAALDPKGPGVFDHEYRTVAPDGTLRWLAARGQSVVENGAVVRFVGTVRDITARRSVDDQIAATLERYRIVGRVTQDVIWDWDLVTNHVIWNEAMTPAYGYRPSEIEPTPGWWLDRVHEDDRERVREDIFRVINGHERDWSHDYLFRRADGTFAAVHDRGSMIRDADGRPLRMIGAMFDNSVRRAEEERQRLINHELSHRMKNILTVVQAMANQTLRSSETMDEAQAVLSGRLIAFSKAHDILVAGETAGAQLAEIVEEAVRLQLDAGERVSIAGPNLLLGQKAALPVAMMMHELTTNASKYGALSTQDGRIAIAWRITGRSGEEMVRLTWTETGGPSVTPPSRKGFGAKLIERGLSAQLGAKVTLSYPETGVVCALEAPLSTLTEKH